MMFQILAQCPGVRTNSEQIIPELGILDVLAPSPEAASPSHSQHIGLDGAVL